MRYWLLRGKKPEGPYQPSELIKEPDFAAEAMVCPEDRPPTKPKNWRAASKVKELKAWLRELDAKEKAVELPWEAERTRIVSQAPPAPSPGPEGPGESFRAPGPEGPGEPSGAPPPTASLAPLARPMSAEDAASRFRKRAVDTRGPELPVFRDTRPPVSNLAAGLLSFSMIVCIGGLAMLLSGRCSAGPGDKKTKLRRAPYVVPAPP